MLVIFDLDGVLVDSKELHYRSLNNALNKIDGKYSISLREHLSIFDGLPTKEKLKKLTELKNFPQSLHECVFNDKQQEFLALLKNLPQDLKLVTIFKDLKQLKYKIAVASNSIRETVKVTLLRLGIIEYVDYFVSNEDVKRPKPHPEMFWKCMVELNEVPDTTIIIEDSVIGRRAALNSGAKLVPVNCTGDVTWSLIMDNLKGLTPDRSPAWKDGKLNLVIPMAGAGSRFQEAGYTFPKPLIDVNGAPMIELVVKNLNIDANYIFIVQKSHYEKYNLAEMLNQVKPGCKIIQVDGVTNGAACTTLLAKSLIDCDQPLVIANSDQYIEYDSNEFMYSVANENVDGALLVFNSHHPKWSYARLEGDIVVEVAEKRVISDLATVGVYYWKRGSDYVRYAEQMISKNIRTNNEFYICPVYNEAILDGKKISIKGVKKMWGLGTPEDLGVFLRNCHENNN